MGERGQIKVKQSEGDIYLYTHWKGDQLVEIVRDALINGKGRWQDEEYLTRIIFCRLVGVGEWNGETGFGIGLSEHDDLNYPLLTVDVGNQKITDGVASSTFSTFCALK